MIKKESILGLGPNALSDDAVTRGIGVTCLQQDDNTAISNCQEIDISKDDFICSELVRSKFEEKKKYNQLLAKSYFRNGYFDAGERLCNCGLWLVFENDVFSNGVVSDVSHLHFGNFCRDRLCPMCSFRRSSKIFAQVMKMIDFLGPDYSYLMLTLTIPSVDAQHLNDSISKLFLGVRKLFNYKKIKSSIEGYLRFFEITLNKDSSSKSFGLYHPHLHLILAVNKSYFNGLNYISQSLWLKYWRLACKDDSISQLRIEKIKNKSNSDCADISSGIAEVVKYSVKSSDIFDGSTDDEADSIVRTLRSALSGRRLFSSSGCFITAKKALNLEDIENSDLTDLSDIDDNIIGWMMNEYGWNINNNLDKYSLANTYFESKEERAKKVEECKQLKEKYKIDANTKFIVSMVEKFKKYSF